MLHQDQTRDCARLVHSGIVSIQYLQTEFGATTASNENRIGINLRKTNDRR